MEYKKKYEFKKIKCDICKQSKHETKHDWIEIKNYWGYCSNKDGQYIECIVCEECWDKVELFITGKNEDLQSLGGKIRKYLYDITTGLILGDYNKKKKEIESYNKRIKNAKYKNK